MAKYRKYTRELLEEAVSQSISYAGVMRYLGLKPAGGTSAHLARMIRKLEIDISHFTGRPEKETIGDLTRKDSDSILVKRDSGTRTKRHLLKRAMIEKGVPYKCKGCGNDGIWMGEELTLDIDHIDGDWLNNELNNLRFLCPNCHRQTETYAGKQKNKRPYTSHR